MSAVDYITMFVEYLTKLLDLIAGFFKSDKEEADKEDKA